MIPSWGEFADILVALGMLVTLYRTWQTGKKVDDNTKQIEVVHLATNSMKDELVAEVRKSEHAAGMKDQRTETAKEAKEI